MRVVSRTVRQVSYAPETDDLRLTMENVYDLDGTPKTILDTQAAGKLSDETRMGLIKGLRALLADIIQPALDAAYVSQATDVVVSVPELKKG